MLASSISSSSDAMKVAKRGPIGAAVVASGISISVRPLCTGNVAFLSLLLLLLLSPCGCVAIIALGRNSSCSVDSSSSPSAPFAPFATSSPPFARVEHPLPLTAHWAPSLLARLGQGKGGALPTNKFWQNFVLKPSNQPVMINPLSVRMEAVDTNNVRILSSEYKQAQ
jgi:endoglucanase Acf2